MQLGLQAFGQTISVTTDDPDFETFLTGLERIHVFAVKRCNTEAYVSHVAGLIHNNGAPASLDYDPATRLLRLVAEWGQISSSGTVENLLGQLLGLECFDAGLVPVHGGVISASEGAYLLIGGSGAGKSTLSAAMMSQFGARWEANDYFCIGRGDDHEVLVKQADDFFDFRVSMLESLRAFFPDSVRNLLMVTNSNDPWAKSSVVPLSLLRDDPAGKLAMPIKGIIFPAIVSRHESVVGRLPARVAAAALLREVAWSLHGIGGFVLGNDGTVLAPSADIAPTAGWQPVCDIVSDLISACPAWAAVGSLNSLPTAIYSDVVLDAST